MRTNMLYLFVVLLLSSCEGSPTMQKDGGFKITLQIESEGLSAQTVKKNRNECIEVLANRLENMYGYACSVKAGHKANEIMVEVPGAKNERHLSQILIQSAALRFCETFHFGELGSGLQDLYSYKQSKGIQIPSFHLPEGFEAYTPIFGMAQARDTAEVSALFRSEKALEIFSENVQFLWGASEDNANKEFALYAVRAHGNRDEELTGNIVENAETLNENGRLSIQVNLTEEGTVRWAALTKKNISRSIAIVLDDRVYSAPMVMESMEGGEVVISGNFSKAEADDFTQILRAGALPCPLKIISLKEVKPSKN